MTPRNKKTIDTPIIGRIVDLAQTLDKNVSLLPKRTQHIYGYPLLNDMRMLFSYACDQLNGKDCYNDVVRVAQKIQRSIYFIHCLPNCWPDKKDPDTRSMISLMDAQCDDILSQAAKLHVSKVRAVKSQDEHEGTK